MRWKLCTVEALYEDPGCGLDIADVIVDAFVTGVEAAIPRCRKLTARDIADLKREHGATFEPARAALDNVPTRTAAFRSR